MATKNSFPIFIATLLALSAFSPLFSLANGGDQRIVEGKYYINLSRAPFTPRAGDKVSMLASFVDLQTNKLVAEDLIVRVRISKLGEAPKGNFMFVQDNIRVRGGVLELLYTFAEPGLHEIFFDFALASKPTLAYEAPDFLLDVQKAASSDSTRTMSIGMGIGGLILGFTLGWFLRRPIRPK